MTTKNNKTFPYTKHSHTALAFIIVGLFTILMGKVLHNPTSILCYTVGLIECGDGILLYLMLMFIKKIFYKT